MRFRQAVFPQIWTILAIFAGVIVLAVWQREFVIAGASSNIYLNCAIFVGIFFGVCLHVWNLWGLKNEFAALDALFEAYEDSQIRATQGVLSQQVLQQRLRGRAEVFSPPNFLGSSFKLLYPPLLREQALKIPSATGKQMVEDVDNRIVSTVAFGNYVAGLMVLLGLLGTFIGLLATVGSVGEILASLDFSSGAGVDQISDLMKSLEAPLGGMATGFSSSLFGLIGSLMLGMMAKVADRSYNALRLDFEEWVNRVAQVEQIDGGAKVDEIDVIEESRRDDGTLSLTRLLANMTHSIVRAQARVADSVDSMNGALRAMASDGAASRTHLAFLSESTQTVASTTVALLERFEEEAARTAQAHALRLEREAERDRRLHEAFDAIAELVEQSTLRLDRQSGQLSKQHAVLEAIATAIGDIAPATERGAEAAKGMQKAIEEMAATVGEVERRAQGRANARARQAERFEVTTTGLLQVLKRFEARETERERREAAADALLDEDGYLSDAVGARLVRGVAAAGERVSRATPMIRAGAMRRSFDAATLDPVAAAKAPSAAQQGENSDDGHAQS